MSPLSHFNSQLECFMANSIGGSLENVTNSHTAVSGVVSSQVSNLLHGPTASVSMHLIQRMSLQVLQGILGFFSFDSQKWYYRREKLKQVLPSKQSKIPVFHYFVFRNSLSVVDPSKPQRVSNLFDNPATFFMTLGNQQAITRVRGSFVRIDTTFSIDKTCQPNQEITTDLHVGGD